MKLGTIFPNADIGTEPEAIRDYARAVEDAGFDYLLAYDHITGAHPDRFAGGSIPGFAGPPYVHESHGSKSRSRSCASCGTEPLVTLKGRWHTLDRVAITPRPARPPPIWIGGGSSDPVLRRVARLADGWMPLLQPTEDAASAGERLRKFLREAGRDAAAFGLDARIRAAADGPDDWIAAAQRWRALLDAAIRMKRALTDSRTV